MRTLFYIALLITLGVICWFYTLDGYLQYVLAVSVFIFAFCICIDRMLSGHLSKRLLAAFVVIGVFWGVLILLQPMSMTATTMYAESEQGCTVYVFDGTNTQFDLPEGSWTQGSIEYKLESTYQSRIGKNYSGCTINDLRTQHGA